MAIPTPYAMCGVVVWTASPIITDLPRDHGSGTSSACSERRSTSPSSTADTAGASPAKGTSCSRATSSSRSRGGLGVPRSVCSIHR
jgi:hypothetical protein